MPPPYFQDVIPTDPPLVTETPSATATFTETASSTPSETATATHTATTLPTSTETLTATYRETPSVTLAQDSQTASATASPTSTASATSAVSINVIPTPTPSATATYSGEGQPGIVRAPVAMPVVSARPVDVTAATVTELINQINAANTRCPTPTVIMLTAPNYNLTVVNNASFYGSNGLPIVRCDITIIGLPGISTIQRNYGGGTPYSAFLAWIALASCA